MSEDDRPIRDFNRFELKYIVHQDRAREFRDRLGEYVQRDPNVGASGEYLISSLYYDSPDFHAYWEKLEGYKFRRKVRVRKYDNDPRDLWFVEIKQRIDKTVQKRRTDAPLEQVKNLMEGGPWEDTKYSTDSVFQEVNYLRTARRLEPTVIVSYNREPFVGAYDQSLRITFDRNLRSRRGGFDDWGNPSQGRLFLPVDMVVVEVKFDNYVPVWLCSLLSQLEYVSERMSKYCSAVSVFWSPEVKYEGIQPYLTGMKG